MLAKPDMLAESRRADPGDPRPGPFQDIPRSIWTIFLSAWGLLFLIFALVFAVNPAATFVVTIAVGFAVMVFGLLTLMARQARCQGYRCQKPIQTRTGPLTVVAAGTQILAVPVCALIGLIAFVTLVM
jgi:hypothetical protein